MNRFAHTWPNHQSKIIHHKFVKVFVTGASGFVGREILRHLYAAEHSVRILARDRRSLRVHKAEAEHRVEIHPGNVLHAPSLVGALTDCDAVIHLVGIISEGGESTFENIHIRGTQNIVSATQQAKVKRFIQMSALGTRANAVSRYHQSKWAAEEIVRRSGLDFTIFRPSIIYGPDDQFVNLFARMSRFSPVLPVMGGEQSRFQPISVGDVATCFLRALTEPKSIGQTFDLCGGEVLTLEVILDQILSVMGQRRFKLHVPLGVARYQAALLEFVFARLLGKSPPLNRDQLVMLQEGNVGNPQPANDLFESKPIPFREGITRYLKRDE
jgi:NADH dehydrogenase